MSLGNVWRNLVEYFLALLVSIVVLLILIEVASRYVFRQSFVFSEEVASIVFLWIVFIGAAVAVKRASHFSLETFGKMLGPRAELPLAVVRDGLVAASGRTRRAPSR